MSDRVYKRRAELDMNLRELSGQKKEWDLKIENLMKKKLSYPEEVTRVMNAIREEFVRIGRTPEPRILCEMLEITDDSWRNAVEGYLNTQRFYILVEPDNFDIALGTYDRLRREKKTYGVGLINTQNLEGYDTAPEGSLATVVTSGNKYARRYINMVLGKVTMCEHYSHLKKYKTAITRECMRYQNHVASAIKPAIFETPYIGKTPSGYSWSRQSIRAKSWKIRSKRNRMYCRSWKSCKNHFPRRRIPISNTAWMCLWNSGTRRRRSKTAGLTSPRWRKIPI